MGILRFFMKKSWVLLVIVLLYGLTNKCFAVGSLPSEQMDMFSQNNITFYDPTACLSAGGTGAAVLSGDTIEKRIWNYFVQAGIPGLSDNPAAIAGIMGNFYDESGYNPFMIGSTGSYYGLYMLQSPQGPQMARNITSTIGRNHFKFWGWWGSYDEVDSDLSNAGITQSEIDTAIKIELDYMMNELSHFDGFKNNLDIVTNKTGEDGAASYAELFMVTVERAVSLPGSKYYGVSQAVEDANVWNYVMNSLYTSGKYHSSSLRYQHISHRRKNAKEIYNRLMGEASMEGFMSDPTLDDDDSDYGLGMDLGEVTSGVTLIGDSISVFSESELMKKFPNSFLNKVGSRHSTTKGWCDGDEGGLSVLKKIVSGSGTIMNQHQGQSKCEAVSVDSSALKENVVWALGTNTNGAKNQSTLEGVLEAIGGRKLYLVTPYNMIPDKMGDTDEIADLYRSFADAHDNVYIIDWNKNVRDNVTQYIDNSDHLGVHPTSAGSELFAKLIAEAVSGSKSCTTYSGDYPQYLQCDAKWKNTSYGINSSGAPGTICGDGCGPASLAMLVTAATGKDVLPTDLAEITQGPGNCSYFNDSSPDCGSSFARVEYTKKVCEKYGCEVKQLPDNNVETIRQALKDGWMIHLSGGAASDAPEASLSTHDTATNPFMTTGHFVGIFKIDNDDKVMVADPAGDAKPGYPGRFNREMTLGQATANRWYNKPIMAIRGSGGNSGKNTCEVAGNYCATDGVMGGGNVGAVEGGLSEAQAQAIISYYKSSEVSASKYQLPSGKCNCVSLSAFFAQEFTTAGLASTGWKSASERWGNGGETAAYLAKYLNLETGTEPRPFAVYSTTRPPLASQICPDGIRCGHTGVVLAVDGDNLLTIEASYGHCGFTGVKHRTRSQIHNERHPFTYAYLDSIIDANKLSKIVGQL